MKLENFIKETEAYNYIYPDSCSFSPKENELVFVANEKKFFKKERTLLMRGDKKIIDALDPIFSPGGNTFIYALRNKDEYTINIFKNEWNKKIGGTGIGFHAFNKDESIFVFITNFNCGFAFNGCLYINFEIVEGGNGAKGFLFSPISNSYLYYGTKDDEKGGYVQEKGKERIFASHILQIDYLPNGKYVFLDAYNNFYYQDNNGWKIKNNIIKYSINNNGDILFVISGLSENSYKYGVEINGNILKYFSNVEKLQWSINNKDYSFEAKKFEGNGNNYEVLYINDQEIRNAYGLVFSPNGEEYSYIKYKEKNGNYLHCVVRNNIEQEWINNPIRDILYSPDGKHISYVVDEYIKEKGNHMKALGNSFFRITYGNGEKPKSYIIYNNVSINEKVHLFIDKPFYSKDGSFFGFIGKKKRGYFVGVMKI